MPDFIDPKYLDLAEYTTQKISRFLRMLRHLGLKHIIGKWKLIMDSKRQKQKLLKVAFIGCGNHAKVNLYPCLQYVPIELVAICAKHMENAEKSAKLFGAQKAYDNYMEMFDKEKIDAVFIAVGPEKHFEMCSNALRKGLHVFVEKPATQNLEQAKELQNISEKSNRNIMVAFMKRFAPTYQKAREIINSRQFSPLTAINTKFCVGPYSSEERFLIDVGIHHLDLIRFFGGEIENINVQKQSFEKKGIFSFAISTKFANGAIGSIFLSSGQLWDNHNERVELSGNNGQFILVDNVVFFRHYRNKNIQSSNNFQAHENNTFWEPNFTVPSESNQTLFLNGFASEINHFVESILRGVKPKPDISDFCYAMQLIESILKMR
jgi:myo-inositol 2-dehydrogenase/D-chiro-inositol 1-dehydrogenase